MDYLKIKKKKINFSNPTDIAKLAAPKAAPVLYNIIRIGPRVILRSMFELLRANTVTRALSAVILLIFDTIDLVRGRVSFKQYLINITLAFLLLVGGTVGWELGNDAVSLILIENVVIGIVAGLIGAGIFGALFGMASEKLIKMFVRDDEADMLAILNRVYLSVIADGGLTQAQAEETAAKIEITPKILRTMFAESDREAFALRFINENINETKEQSI